MGLSATVDLKRPAMESECQYNMRKDGTVGRSDSVEILDRSSPPPQNGHLVSREMSACDADASMSSAVIAPNDAAVSTRDDISVQGKVKTIHERCDGSTAMCGLQMVDSNRGSLPNGKGLLSDSGPFLDPSEQMIQIGQGIQQTSDSNHLPQSIVEAAPRPNRRSAHPVEPLKEPSENNVDAEQSILRSFRCTLVVDQVEQIPAVTQVPMAVQESEDACTRSCTSESDAVYEPIQESPASPDPVSEVSWLPPLYIPEIPLSCDEVEEEQSSLDCDPQLMQAVLELSTSADAPPSRLSRKSTPPQVPVPVEPHSLVHSFDRVHYSRTAHGRKDAMTKRLRQGSMKSDKKVVEPDKTVIDGQLQSQSTVVKVADESEVIEPMRAEVDTKKSTSFVKRQPLQPAHDVVAGTSNAVTPLTVNTDFNRSSAEMHRKCGVVSAPLSAGSDRSTPEVSGRDFRRQSSGELGTDEQITLPTEQALNKALDLLRSNDACLPHEHPLQPSSSLKATLVRGSSQRKKEVVKRKTMQDRLDRIREHGALVLSIPAFQNVNTTQMAILLRRFKKYWKVRNYLSDELIEHVLSDQPKERQMTLKSDSDKPVMMDEEAVVKLRASDPDATESSSGEEDDESDAIPSTSNSAAQVHIRDSPLYRLHEMRVEFGAIQARAEYEEEECARLIEVAKQQLMQLQSNKECFISDVPESDEERGCARCIPVKSTLRRKILRNTMSGFVENSAEVAATSMSACDRIPAYASLDGSLNKSLSSLTAVPLRRRVDTYLRRKSMRPAYFARLSLDRAPWISYLQNKRGLGVSEERRKRKRDIDRKGSSMSPFRKACRSSSASDRRVSLLRHAGNKLVRRSLDCKRNGEKALRSGISLERRSSAASVNHGTEVSTSSESNLDLTIVGLPQKIDYKEIFIPKWRRLAMEASPLKAEWPCTGLAEVSCAAEISRLHLPLELNERKRFQQYRDHVASKAVAASKLSGTQSKMSATHSKNSTASQSKTSAAGSASCSTDTRSSNYSTSAAPSPAPAIFQFDDEHSNSAIENAMVPSYDRPSVVKPYSPRSFPLPPSLLHKHLT
uniref:PEHE domain-containing protein n=1 Tax=Parascaris univalens TaxID=6257 RepID=A0A915BYD2_PARUN